MDKRKEVNKIVRQKIGRALIILMENRHFSDITVTDIVNRAGVARASYYRNFSSKEDVLVSLTEDIMADYRHRTELLAKEYTSYDSILLAFRYFRVYRKQILCVHRAGLSSIYQQILDLYVEEAAGDMPFNDIRRYQMYFFSGALYHVFIQWLENDLKESAKDMAKMFYDTIHGGM